MYNLHCILNFFTNVQYISEFHIQSRLKFKKIQQGHPPPAKMSPFPCSFQEKLGKWWIAPPLMVGAPLSGKSWIRHWFALVFGCNEISKATRDTPEPGCEARVWWCMRSYKLPMCALSINIIRQINRKRSRVFTIFLSYVNTCGIILA